MVIIGSGIARGRVRTTTKTTASRNFFGTTFRPSFVTVHKCDGRDLGSAFCHYEAYFTAPRIEPAAIFSEMEPRSRPSHLCTVTKLGVKVVPKKICANGDGGVAQYGGHTPNNRLIETCSLGLPCSSLILEIHVVSNRHLSKQGIC